MTKTSKLLNSHDICDNVRHNSAKHMDANHALHFISLSSINSDVLHKR